MNLSVFNELLSPIGQAALSDAQALRPREVDFLAHFQLLSRKYPRALARIAIETAIFRVEAASKFPRADCMYFNRDALQQASGHQMSGYRARRYSGFDFVIDLGCSVGGDTLALAEVAPTIGVDCDPLRLAMAQANLRALGLQVDFIQADITPHLPFCPSPALFFDPARRTAGRRVFSVRDYLPPLSIVNGWLPQFPALGVKISPGVKLDELGEYDAEIEFISYKRGLKEAVLWFGPLKSTGRRATVLPGPYTLTSEQPSVLSSRLSEPLAYLFEPDASILRAGLVRDLAVRLDAYQLDSDIAYLTADQAIETPFARVWEIEDWFPFQLKRLRAYLRERDVGRVVVKKRGSPLQPDALIRDLRLKGSAQRVVFLTHLRGRPIVVVGYP